MEKEIEILFNKNIIEAAAKKYGATSKELRLLGSHQNFVYEYELNGITQILRITHSSHRSFEQLNAELHWIDYLVYNGILASKALTSPNNKLIEVLSSDKGKFFITSFEKANGLGIGKYPWDKAILNKLGSITGKMHRLSKDYAPQREDKRFHWYDNDYILQAERYIPGQDKVIAKLHQLINKLHTLPKDNSSYGLIHGDILACNYNVAQGNIITLFDFDECSYNWFINDIAIQFFYCSMDCFGNIDKEGALEDCINFWKGYSSENSLDPFWFEQIPLFLKLREIILYIAICRSYNINNASQWTKNFMNERKYRIENDVPFIDISFAPSSNL